MSLIQADNFKTQYCTEKLNVITMNLNEVLMVLITYIYALKVFIFCSAVIYSSNYILKKGDGLMKLSQQLGVFIELLKFCRLK
jgi:hypothetical protein